MVRIQRFAILAVSMLFTAGVRAEDIDGNVLIKRKLTKRSVTAAVSIYQRGTVVGLKNDPVSGAAESEDPLAFERSRVAIWVEGNGPAGAARATMQQIGRRFFPEVLVVPAGSVVSFPNMDPIFHNVFSLSRPKMFDLGNYPKGDSREVTFGKPGVVFVNCHLHPNMVATIVVTPNAWLAKPDAGGRFALKNLPPGDYVVVAWHKAAGFFRKPVHIEAGKAAQVEFFIPLEAEPADPHVMAEMAR